MKSYSSREVIKILKENGWYLERVCGSHHQFKHPTNPKTIPVKNPTNCIPIGTLKNIERLSGIKFK
nr:type II toxin-antitoxin system HicA family toxin [Clostridium chromiireducens]